MEILKPGKRRRPQVDSYDQKLEQRAAKHEFLRDRNNTTMCRSPGARLETDWKSEMHQKRQMEFQRRRNISQADTSQSDEESNKETKVTMRPNRHKVPLIHRQSLITAEELGIIWPDVCSIEKATLTTSPSLRGTGKQKQTVNKQAGLVKSSSQLEQRNACCQTEHGNITVKEADLLQLAEYLQEALWREDSLKQKLAVLQCTTSTLLLSHDNVWKNCYKDDQMKRRTGALESQLKICVQRLSRDGAKMLLLQSEKQRQELEEVAVTTLQKVTDQKTKAQDRAHSLEVALQTTQAESLQWKERYEEERRKCTHLRTSRVKNMDRINLLQSQLEGVLGHEATLKKQLTQHQQTEADLHLQIHMLEDNLNICRLQLETWRQREQDDKKEREMINGNEQDLEPTVDVQLPPAVPHHNTKKQSILEINSHKRERRRCSCFIPSLLLLILVVTVFILFLADIPTRNQMWDLYQELQDRTKKYLDDMKLPQHCYRPI
ncbi:hypothetical protein DPEC_G00212130 [Dallia pectoralis]|uniref:Uncharacterized protein n=1 Tax=Dallia pectoralis TaxID=75939 RepID=A0ACC2G6E3_DALPE|nr:hypothetical protein DPEC_G00212130 [Dallia pectoralis]